MCELLTDEERIAEARRAYQREWRKKNKKHVRKYNQQYREANRDKIRENNRRYWLKKSKEMQL